MNHGQIITFSLICDKCTRTAAFHGASEHDCKVRAMRAGWVQEHGKDICPSCPARRVLLCTFECDPPCNNEQWKPAREQSRAAASDSWCRQHIEANRPQWKNPKAAEIREQLLREWDEVYEGAD